MVTLVGPPGSDLCAGGWTVLVSPNGTRGRAEGDAPTTSSSEGRHPKDSVTRGHEVRHPRGALDVLSSL